MSVKVNIPTQLRSVTGGATVVAGTTGALREVIEDLDRRYPGFGARILDEQGSLRRFVNIYVDQEDVRFLDGLSAPVNPGATVAIIPAVAGG